MSLTLTLERGGGEVSGSGTNIELDGTIAGGAIESVEMYGDTEQTTYSGKNLFRVPETPDYVNTGTTYTKISEGSFSIEVSPAASWKDDRFLVTGLQPNTTYTFKATFSNSNSSVTNNWFMLRDGGINGTVLQQGNINSSTSKTFTTTNNTTIAICLSATVGTAYENTMTVSNIQLEQGSTATSFEPYVGGTASPNPDYPQEVQTVTGRQVVNVTTKNLLNIYYSNPIGYSYTTNGVTFTLSEDGGIKMSGTGAGSKANFEPLGGSWSDTQIKIPLDPTKTYMSSITRPSNAYRWYLRGIVNGEVTTLNSNNDALTIQNCTGITYALFQVVPNASVSGTAYPQVESGNSASQFVPYQSQEYEINLGKNLLDNYNPTIVSANTTWTPTANGGLYTATSGWTGGVQWKLTVETGSTYQFQYKERTDQNLYLYITTYTDSTYTTVKTRLVNDGRYTKYPIVPDSPYLEISFNNSSAMTNVAIEELMFEKASTRTTYAPYFTPIELCKIGTYQDYIYKRGENWYLHKETGMLTFDGSETWSLAAAYTGYTRASVAAGENHANNEGYCNEFINRGSQAHGGYEYVWIQPNANAFYIQVLQSRADSLAAFKAWLASNPATIYYALATATDTQITNSALIAQLDALNAGETYDGTTLITVSSENLAGSLEVKVSSNITKTYTEVEIGSPFTIADVEGKSSNTTLDGNVYVDWAYNKKQYSFDLFNLTPQDYADIRAFYDYQFNNSAFPTITVPELNIDKLPVYMEISSRNIINQCLLTDKLTIKFRETVQP